MYDPPTQRVLPGFCDWVGGVGFDGGWVGVWRHMRMLDRASKPNQPTRPLYIPIHHTSTPQQFIPAQTKTELTRGAVEREEVVRGDGVLHGPRHVLWHRGAAADGYMLLG